MVRDIDDIADERATDIQMPGQEFHDDFLVGRPKPEWPPYIDESAQDVSAGIGLGDADLGRDNFAREVGRYYRRGLEQSTGAFTDLPEVLREHLSDDDLGQLAYQLNELSYEIADTDVDHVQDATEAVLEKLLTRHVGENLELSLNLNGSTVAHIATQLFEHETIASNVDVILEEVDRGGGRSLLAFMDEPQMMTPLWEHQREALVAWQENGYRGYVDMATATGKTVLGLAALALRYGELHPADQDDFEPARVHTEDRKADVLVVAHNDLILEQWRREFDRHLNIPRERTSGGEDIELDWGRIHFRTPAAVINQETTDYDLVLLDEVHHYAKGGEWGTLLDAFEGDVMALSGSVDDAGTDSERIRDRLENSVGERLERYTIVEAKDDGIIPSFDWEIQYATYDDAGADLEEASRRAEEAFDTFRDRVERGDVSVPDDRRLETYEDVRRFSHTTEGNDLKQRDDQFRDLVTRLFSRRTKRWNLSPSLDAIVDLVEENATTENVVVLADNNAQVEELETRVRERLAESTPVSVVTKDQSNEDQQKTIDEFDVPESSGVLLGTGDLLGEGVDMHHASVAINMATGGVNPELVQRIGRVLRNPTDTPKYAMFYNVVGVPATLEASVHREDGRRLLEEAAGFCSLGARFEKLPGFTAAAADRDVLEQLIVAGGEFVEELDELGGDEESDEHLRSLHELVRTEDGVEAVLGEWEEYAWEHSDRDEAQEGESTPESVAEEESVVEDSGDAGGDSDRADEVAEHLDAYDRVDDDRNTDGEGRTDDGEEETDDEKSDVAEPATEPTGDRYERIVDIVDLEPTSNRELAEEWGFGTGSAVHEYLERELAAYYRRDDEGRIRPSQDALFTVIDGPEDTDSGRTENEAADGASSTQPPEAETDRPEEAQSSEDGASDESSEPDVRDRDLVFEYVALTQDLGHPPTVDEIDEHADYPFERYGEAFEDVYEALRSSGVIPESLSRDEFYGDELDAGAAETDDGDETGEDHGYSGDVGGSDDGDGTEITTASAEEPLPSSSEDATEPGAEPGPDDGNDSDLEDVSIESAETGAAAGPPEEGESDVEVVSGESDESGSGAEPEEPDESGLEIVPVESTGTDADDAEPADESDESAGEDDGGDGGPPPQRFFWDRETEALDVSAVESETVAPDDESESGERDELDRKIDEWKSQLLDLSRRNKLISFKPTKTKSLPLEGGDPTGAATALVEDDELYIRKKPDDDADGGASEDVEPSDDELVSSRGGDATDDSLRSVGRYQKRYLRERGVDTLYLSLGMLRWYGVDHSDDALRSPLFLAPVELEQTTVGDEDRHNYTIRPKSEEVRLNPALRKKLAADHGLELPGDGALSLDRLDAAFEAVDEAIGGFERWRLQDDVVLGIFDFAKYSLYSDLEENRELVKGHPVVRALNGDPEPLREREGDVESPAADELDDVVDPADTFQVLDADSSQQEAIEAAKRGKSFVLQGPPGTGKSQTIANVVAEKLAVGESVLFVSEKQAALDVVKDRLDDVGVGRFCLEAHGEKATNTEVLSSLEEELKAGKVRAPDEREGRLSELRERRNRINAYGDHLFYLPEGWDLTAYRAFGIVEENRDAPRVDLEIDEPTARSQAEVESVVDDLETLARFDEQIRRYDTDPWRHNTLEAWSVDTKAELQRSLADQREVLEAMDEFSDEVHVRVGVRPETLTEHDEVARLLDLLAERPDVAWRPRFFEDEFVEKADRIEEYAELEADRAALNEELLEHYERSFLAADGAALHDELAGYGLFKILKSSYRSTKRSVLGHARSGYSPGYEEVLEDTRKLAELQRLEDRREEFDDVRELLGPLEEGPDTDWEAIREAQSWVGEFDEVDPELAEPVVRALVDGDVRDAATLADRAAELAEEYDEAAAPFRDAMDAESLTVAGDPFRSAPLPDVIATLRDLEGRLGALQEWFRFRSNLDDLRDTFAAEYVDEFLDAGHDPEYLVASFRREFYTKWLGGVYRDTTLDTFDVAEMERSLETFRRLDREQLELAKVAIQHRVTEQRPSLQLDHASSSEQVTVRREAEKQRRHMPLRELFEETGSFVTDLTPCFMMSPLSVAQYLPVGAIEFDAVVFDEASQIMPQDAISSIIRADQVIVAGDSNQLPPTSFFRAEVETAKDVREDLDSILEETAAVLPEKHLRWHYRSRSEELIEFSNQLYYGGSLQTFPENDPEVETGVDFDYVEDGVYDRGGTRQNVVEAERVVDLVEDHAESHPDRSLGVVAFSTAQETAIREELDRRREDNGVLDAFVGQDDVLDEFFVKNLEMVQGDERDRMIFSVGYGPDDKGKLSMNFGPLNRDGGERRLNVAVTRAREHVTIVSSLQPGDIDLTRTDKTGVEHLKKYLEYAKNGPSVLERDDHVTEVLEFDSGFEEAVYDALEARGYDVVSQVESGGYSIDLAVKHPDRPGKFVLGIECDGAAYHSSKTARDRDRIRQSVLEDLGWTIHRIWSPNWVTNREQELEAIDEAVDDLVSGTSADGGAVTESADDVRTYEPETETAGDDPTTHDLVEYYDEPTVEQEGDERYDQVPNAALQDKLAALVESHGPIEAETAYRTVVGAWGLTRLGKKIRRSMNGNALSLHSDGRIVKHDGFLWPPLEELSFEVRINGDGASRDVDEIPLEEIAEAGTLVLSEGGSMTVDDLKIEIARLFGYKRRGQRIRNRIGEAIDLLHEDDVLAEGDGHVSLEDAVDARAAILSNVYPSISDPSEAESSDDGDGD